MNKKILECSTKGDKRFSAFYAKIDFLGKFESIEYHYQTAKVYLDENKLKTYEYKNGKFEGKGKECLLIKIGDRFYPSKYLSHFYNLLWVKYLDKNKHLIKILEQYDDYTDMFKSKNSLNCQADTIRKYIKEGRSQILKEASEFIQLMRSDGFIVYEGDVFKSGANIVGHQTNCLGKMGGGIATTVKKDYPNVFNDYKILCNKYESNKSKLLGHCQIVQVDDNFAIANLFGQLDINQRNKLKTNKTQYDKLEQALILLRNKAMKEGKTIALPYGIGCGAAGGDWDIVSKIIKKVFNVYPIILYKYKI